MDPSEKSDPYQTLRLPSPTPDEEICKCPDQPPIVLQDALSEIPFACLRCNLEVPPERIGFRQELARSIAHWRDLHRSVYLLWLDSEDYEEWARAQLADPRGRINVLGLENVDELNAHRRAYYHWFEDESSDDFVPPSQCPRCGGELSEQLGCLVCERCSIMVHRRDRPHSFP